MFRLSNSGESAVEQAGRDLETLRRLRNRADYDEVPALTQPQAAAAVQLAKGITQALDATRQEPPRTRMQMISRAPVLSATLRRVSVWII